MESKTILATTKRLILRRYKKEDLQDLFEYLSDKKVVEFEPYKPMSLDEAKENLKWLEALGFCREAHLKQNVYFWKDGDGKPVWKDTYIYAKLCTQIYS